MTVVICLNCVNPNPPGGGDDMTRIEKNHDDNFCNKKSGTAIFIIFELETDPVQFHKAENRYQIRLLVFALRFSSFEIKQR